MKIRDHLNFYFFAERNSLPGRIIKNSFKYVIRVEQSKNKYFF